METISDEKRKEKHLAITEQLDRLENALDDLEGLSCKISGAPLQSVDKKERYRETLEDFLSTGAEEIGEAVNRLNSLITVLKEALF